MYKINRVIVFALGLNKFYYLPIKHPIPLSVMISKCTKESVAKSGDIP